jgi:hypothetical protein
VCCSQRRPGADLAHANAEEQPLSCIRCGTRSIAAICSKTQKNEIPIGFFLSKFRRLCPLSRVYKELKAYGHHSTLLATVRKLDMWRWRCSAFAGKCFLCFSPAPALSRDEAVEALRASDPATRRITKATMLLCLPPRRQLVVFEVRGATPPPHVPTL